MRATVSTFRNQCVCAHPPKSLRLRDRHPACYAHPMLEGLPPNNATHVMRLICDAATALQIATIIVETFDPAETAATAFEESSRRPDLDDGPWVVEAYFGTSP